MPVARHGLSHVRALYRRLLARSLSDVITVPASSLVGEARRAPLLESTLKTVRILAMDGGGIRGDTSCAHVAAH